VQHSTVASVHAFTRRELAQDSKIRPIRSDDAWTWPNEYPTGAPLFFSALGTTARIAGGFKHQRRIDYDLNLALARAAKEAGARVYVLVSTSGASPDSMVPYSKMKGELDEAVKAIGFEHVVILKPGLLVGTRSDSRPGEYAARAMASLLERIGANRLKDPWAHDAHVVAAAAVRAGLGALSGERTDRVRVLNQSEIIRLGRSK